MFQGINAQSYLKDCPLKTQYQKREILQGTLVEKVAQGSDFQIHPHRQSETNWGQGPAVNAQLFLELSAELGIVQRYWFFRHVEYKISGVTWACTWPGNVRQGQIPYERPGETDPWWWWLEPRNTAYHLSKSLSTEWSQPKRGTIHAAGLWHFRVELPKLIGAHLTASCALDVRHGTTGSDVRPALFFSSFNQIFSHCPFCSFLLEWEWLLYMLMHTVSM